MLSILSILECCDFQVNLTYQVADRWESGDLVNIGHCVPPAQPSRTETLQVVQAGKTKRLGKAGSLVSTKFWNLNAHIFIIMT